MFRNLYLGFLGGSDNEESACNGDDLGSIPGQEYLLEYGMVQDSKPVYQMAV